MSESGRRSRTKEVRPTSGKVLGALFSMLGDLRGRSFLDLFSGTGRVALQAAERGASPVVAVEIIAARAREIRAMLPYEPSGLVLAMDVRRALSLLRRKMSSSEDSACFDIIFADPPYGAGWPATIGMILFPPDGGVLSSDGIAVVEHSIREELSPGATYRIFDRREYGETVLSFLASIPHPGKSCEVKGEEE